MELTHLKYFLAVAEELHFGNAAKRLNMAQPPLSQQIMRLEDELGVKLFSRTSRSVKLTEEGKLFQREAGIILSRSANAVEKLREFAERPTRKISIGFNEPAINTFLPAAIVDFRRKYPEIKLILHELTTTEQLNALDNGTIDIGLLRPFQHELSRFEVIHLFEEPYVLALPLGHKLAKGKSIKLKQLGGVPLILFSRSMQPKLFDVIAEQCRANGFEPDIVQETMTKHTALALVKAELGLAIVPASSANFASGDIVFKPLKASLPNVEMTAVINKDKPREESKLFLDFIIRHANDFQDR